MKDSLMSSMKILVLCLLAISCRTREGDSLSQQKDLVSSQACARVTPVQFIASKSKTVLPAIRALPKPSMRIEVSAEDLAKATSIDCKANGLCEAIINRPVIFDKSVPIGTPGINSQLTLGYRQEADDKGKICMRRLRVGTAVSPFPHCMGEILSASVEIGVQIKQALNPESQKIEFKAEPYCQGNLKCSLPFLSLAMHADEQGVEFEATATTKNLSDNFYLQKIMPSKTKLKRINYEDLPEKLAQLKAAVKQVNETLDPDYAWKELAEGCSPGEKG